MLIFAISFPRKEKFSDSRDIVLYYRRLWFQAWNTGSWWICRSAGVISVLSILPGNFRGIIHFPVIHFFLLPIYSWKALIFLAGPVFPFGIYHIGSQGNIPGCLVRWSRAIWSWSSWTEWIQLCICLWFCGGTKIRQIPFCCGSCWNSLSSGISGNSTFFFNNETTPRTGHGSASARGFFDSSGSEVDHSYG